MFYLHIILCNVVLTKSPQSRKPAPPTIIFYVLSKIRKSVNRSVFCASAKSCISSVSVKDSAWFRKNLTAKTFICATRNLIWDVANRLHVLQAGLLSQTTFCILLARIKYCVQYAPPAFVRSIHIFLIIPQLIQIKHYTGRPDTPDRNLHRFHQPVNCIDDLIDLWFHASSL